MNSVFLIASLPALTFLQKPSITTESFEALCEEHLGVADARAAALLCRDLDLGGETPAHPFTALWIDREIQLRNAVASARAARRKTDATGSIRPHKGFDTYIEDDVESAFDLTNPLDREQALDRLRWTHLDELAGVDPLAVTVVLAYAVKLRIAQRWAAMDTQAAMERVDNALNATGGDAHGRGTPDVKQQPPTAAVSMKAKL
jgi:hypothetical protein